MKLFQLFITTITVLFFLGAKPFIEVDGAHFRLLKLAVPAAVAVDKDADLLAAALISKLRSDLEFSAVFEILDPNSYLVDHEREKRSRQGIVNANWQIIGAEGVVKIELSTKGPIVEAKVGIFQIGVTGKSQRISVQANKSQISRLAHRIAADVYKFFTNEEGIFFSKIAAAKAISNNKQIVVMDFDGDNSRSLTDGSALAILPSFSPSGEELFFTEYSNNANLVAINLDTQAKKTISSIPGMNMAASISAQNGQIAMTQSNKGSSHIFIVDRNNSKPKPLTSGWGINTSPSWSPDGKQIAFVSNRSGTAQIYTMNADGSEQIRRTFQGKYNQTPRWSPKGDVIAFTARDELKRFDIFLLDVKKWVIRRVTQNQGDNEDPSFSPDGNMMAFSSTRTGKREVFLANIDGSIQRQITFGGNYSTPVFGKGT